MKSNYLLMVACIIAVNTWAQSNESMPMNFHIVKEYFPPVLDIVPGSVQFKDADNNGVIDANETCKMCFEISNTGRGEAYACVAKMIATGSAQGIDLRDYPLPTIAPHSTKKIEVPIVANENTVTGEIELTLYVDEPNGYGTEQIHSKIGTHRLKTPWVNVTSYKISGDNVGVLERRKPFIIQLAVQNTDQGVAENVHVKINMPANVNWNGGDEPSIVLPTLQPGETKYLEYELMANTKAEENIDIQVALSEKTGKYAQSQSIPLQFGQHIGSTITMNVARNDSEVEIHKVSLTSDVDENIPVTNAKNTNTYAVIIANENYYQVASVPFALNDGKIFKEYCEKTLGIPAKKIHYVPNATLNQIKAEVAWLQNVVDVADDAKVLFYYAGHGIPDESNRSSYLLPVDGLGNDVSTGYKLDDLYATLGAMNSESISIFMDACFSGSKRETGMLASARGVAIKSKSGAPQGKMVIFSAAQGDETAYPYKEQQHGLFTYYLLKKLQETSGNATFEELSTYINKNVRLSAVEENGKPQTPTTTASSSIGDAWKSWTLK